MISVSELQQLILDAPDGEPMACSITASPESPEVGSITWVWDGEDLWIQAQLLPDGYEAKQITLDEMQKFVLDSSDEQSPLRSVEGREARAQYAAERAWNWTMHVCEMPEPTILGALERGGVVSIAKVVDEKGTISITNAQVSMHLAPWQLLALGEEIRALALDAMGYDENDPETAAQLAAEAKRQRKNDRRAAIVNAQGKPMRGSGDTPTILLPGEGL